MWITRYGKHSFIRTGTRTAARRVREIPATDNRQGLLVPKGFDVASQPPFRRNIQALAAGVEPRKVWLAVCDVQDVPAERRLGRDIKPRAE